ncbi:MAG: DNA alkylation repair protein [Chloroflexi bacterium]|nr:DNA alkylation repair protein [Chloroflexota bacterium]
MTALRRTLNSTDPMTCEEVLSRIRDLGSSENRAGMARFGINAEKACGVSVPTLRMLAKEVGRSHDLAAQLWDSGVHEARILACLIDDPRQVTETQMERWVADLDSWDVCDGACGALFDKTPFAYAKAVEWSARSEEYVKRAAFSLMAALAVHDKKAADEKLIQFLPIIEREADDDRNFVKKAVNWALRQIGKRNLALNAAAVRVAEEIRATNSRSARWIASNTLRELTSDKVLTRLQEKEAKSHRRERGVRRELASG